MCLFASSYCFIFFSYAYLDNAYYRGLIYPLTFITGIASFLAYLETLTEYFKASFPKLKYVKFILLCSIVLMIGEVFNYIFFDNYFLFYDSKADPTLSYLGMLINENMPFIFKPNTIGSIIFKGAFGITLSIAAYMVIWIRKNHPEEKLLTYGLIVTFLLGIHDSLYSMGVFYYTMPLMYCGYIIETIRFTSVNQRDAYLKAAHLQNELTKVAKVAHVGEIAGAIFHDIRNPLGILSLYSSQLKRQIESKEEENKMQKSVSVIKKNIDRVESIISSYIGLIHHNPNRKPKLEILHDVINEAIELTMVKTRSIKVKVQNNIDPEIKIDCFLSDFILVVTNLINNSCDAITNSEDKWITIDYVDGEIQVTDSGFGIPKEIADHIFEMQYTTKEEGSGTGIGLGIVKEVLSKMNYNIRIDHESKNTTFIISKTHS